MELNTLQKLRREREELEIEITAFKKQFGKPLYYAEKTNGVLKKKIRKEFNPLRFRRDKLNKKINDYKAAQEVEIESRCLVYPKKIIQDKIDFLRKGKDEITASNFPLLPLEELGKIKDKNKRPGMGFTKIKPLNIRPINYGRFTFYFVCKTR